MSRRQAIKLGIGAGAAIVIGGGAYAYLSTTPSAPSQTKTSTSAATLTQRWGGTLVIAVVGDPRTLNVDMSSASLDRFPALNLWAPLLKNPELNPKPHLAKSWQWNANYTSIKLNLVNNAKFHDGKPLTSADVKFTLDQVVKPYHPAYLAYGGAIDSVQTQDDYTIVINLNRAFPEFTSYLTSRWTGGIVPKHVYGNSSRDDLYNDKKPVGSGPFKFLEYVKGDHLTLVKNENYFNGLPYLDKIVYKIVPDATARINGLETGDWDAVLHFMFPITGVKVLQGKPGINVDTQNGQGAHGGMGPVISFNLRNDITGNQKVRQAIAYAIDRNDINDKAFFALASVATSVIPHVMGELYNPNLIRIDRDLSKANQLLDQAGYPKKADGTRFKLTIDSDASFSEWTKTGELMKEHLAPVGIDLTVNALPRSANYDKTFVKWDFDMNLMSYSVGPVPLLSDANTYFTSGGIQKAVFTNLTGYPKSGTISHGDRIDQVFKEYETATDTAKRKALTWEMQQIIWDDLPYFPILERLGQLAIAWNNKFVGFPVGDAVSHDVLDEIWWTGGSQTKATQA